MFVLVLVFDYVLHSGCHQGNWINALAKDYWSPALYNQPKHSNDIFYECFLLPNPDPTNHTRARQPHIFWTFNVNLPKIYDKKVDV